MSSGPSDDRVNRGPGDRGIGESDDRPVPREASPFDGEPLAHRTVEYPTGPDRCTIFPPATPDHVRMTTWLTANRRAFVDLEAWR